MSNKSLKVYKILFITQVKTLHLNVKFPCDIKMTWKRSNETAETQRVKLVDGKVEFNQTLKLNVNMYFDTTLNKFVQKKCIYSFLIFTQKGQKSAGSITFDLSDFFNKRLYDFEDSFVLQKCPVKDTKIDMKIYYQQSVQSGYDSMSQISVTSQMDISSSNPLDMSQMNQSRDDHSEKSSSTVEGQSVSNKSEKVSTPKEEPEDRLNDSDVQPQFKSMQLSHKAITSKNQIKFHEISDAYNKENKIGENIKGIQDVTHKLNDFVGKFKQNMGHETEEKKRKINMLTEQLQTAHDLNKKLQAQLKEEKNLKNELQLSLNSLKTSSSTNESEKSKKIQQLERKVLQYVASTEMLEKQLTDNSSKGEEEGKYIQQLKDQFKHEEQHLKAEIQSLNKQTTQIKGKNSQLQTKLKRSQQNYQELNQKYDRLLNKYQNLERDISKREEQIQEARINLDKSVQNLINSLSTMF